MSWKKLSTASSKRCMEPYKRLAAIWPFSRSQMFSTGLRCEQYFGR